MAQEIVRKGGKGFYVCDNSIIALTTAWVNIPFIKTSDGATFRAIRFHFMNMETTGADYLEWSFDAGTTTAGRLYVAREFDDYVDGAVALSMRSVGAGVAYVVHVR